MDDISPVVPLLRIHLLGRFRVERADLEQAVSGWQRHSAKTLTKLLALQQGHALHREQIIEFLWSGADAESGLNSFGKALYAARHALEPSLPRRQDSAYLRLVDAMLVLNTEHVIIDTDQFEHLAEIAMRTRKVEAYQAALRAYSGELLPENRYESWCSERRGVLEELRIRLLLEMADELVVRGAYNDAAERLREVVRHDPTREAAHRKLMELYAGMGTSDQAVRQFHICKDILSRELDIAPQPETIALYQKMQSNRLPQPTIPAPGRGQTSPSVPAAWDASKPPFVGRERVLQRMSEMLACHDVNQTGMIVVSGEAGVGKTRLLEEFASRARAQGAVTLRSGRGAQADQFACGPFAVALEDYAASRPEAERAELARMYPALARFVPSLGAASQHPHPAPDIRDYHLDIIPSIVRFLSDLARTRPVLLVLGDLHDADSIGLDLIRYLAHLAVRLPLLIVGALSDADIMASAGLRQMIEAMTRERLWLRIELHCLSRRATDQLVQAILRGVRLREEALAQLYAQTRGNPLLVGELVSGMGSASEAATTDEGDQGSFVVRLQDRIRALTALRLALMDEPLRRVLGLAAGVGTTEISLTQLRAGAGALEPPVSSAALFDALDRALRLRLLEERDAGYAFRHPVVRSAFNDCLPRHRRDEFQAALRAPAPPGESGGTKIRRPERMPGGDMPAPARRPGSTVESKRAC
jgi:DNA-binding SARP family transcriptional activator